VAALANNYRNSGESGKRDGEGGRMAAAIIRTDTRVLSAGCDNEPPIAGWLSQPAGRKRRGCAAGGSGGDLGAEATLEQAGGVTTA